MRVAIIGIGKMGLLHAGILNALDGVELCAMSDTSKYLLGIVKNLKPIPVHDDYLKMLDREKPDAAVIATPVKLHVPMMRECAKRGIHFLVEKPLSLNAPEAEPLIHEVADKKLVTMAGYMLRYAETFRKAKQVIASGALGRIQSVQGSSYVGQLFKPGKGWRYSRAESGGGVVIGQATHLLDLMHWYFGDPVRVSATCQHLYSEDVEDAAHGQLEFAHGVSGWFDCSWSRRHHRLLEIEVRVQAENGDLMVNDDSLRLHLEQPASGHAAGWTHWKKPDLFEGVPIDVGGPQYTRQDEAFARAVLDGGSVETDLAAAWRVQKTVDAIYHSADRRGEPVTP